MGYEAKIVADSLSPQGIRLTTFAVTYPHAIHKDIMTHRQFSRNFQSFRAYPPEKVIANIKEDPFIPEVFGKRVKGMEQGEELEGQDQARKYWLSHVEHAIDTAEMYLEMDVAKQQVNFLLQDFTWITGLITSTFWDNFWALRADPTEAGSLPRPEVQKVAKMMKKEYEGSYQRKHILEQLPYNWWHLPLITTDELADAVQSGDWDYWKKVSVGRCARVSYLTHKGSRDPEKDIALHDGLMQNGHMSPFEHVAKPIICELDTAHVEKTIEDPPASQYHSGWSGNYFGWHQYRKDIPGEDNYRRLVA